MSDYQIEPGGTAVVFSSQRSTQRASGTTHPPVGARLVFRSKWETLEFVQAGESEGFIFDGKEFLHAG